ncbi:hypothetical protein [Corynebacterium cystitidis]|uniref:Uncharacterized protein n=1 Tax=Corynebacterium cystitidis DSM 20524 TaxID=1121357 RepID=A0A1H9SM63_9CORY|nr:hypothetical protein [Corynebacterium cystitidis]WJY83077.1 hypothetical protein CCYS_10890 [Corynebacterium cystitidis DSM 20524]SER85379.1 hypothetical protein SAMN05661109_01156 [Corynebacterium cystitidis DSM 20524]SNV65945.1 Uncharacterised protein [Corynebacterium cystitidis]
MDDNKPGLKVPVERLPPINWWPAVFSCLISIGISAVVVTGLAALNLAFNFGDPFLEKPLLSIAELLVILPLLIGAENYLGSPSALKRFSPLARIRLKNWASQALFWIVLLALISQFLYEVDPETMKATLKGVDDTGKNINILLFQDFCYVLGLALSTGIIYLLLLVFVAIVLHDSLERWGAESINDIDEKIALYGDYIYQDRESLRRLFETDKQRKKIVSCALRFKTLPSCGRLDRLILGASVAEVFILSCWVVIATRCAQFLFSALKVSAGLNSLSSVPFFFGFGLYLSKWAWDLSKYLRWPPIYRFAAAFLGLLLFLLGLGGLVILSFSYLEEVEDVFWIALVCSLSLVLPLVYLILTRAMVPARVEGTEALYTGLESRIHFDQPVDRNAFNCILKERFGQPSQEESAVDHKSVKPVLTEVKTCDARRKSHLFTGEKPALRVVYEQDKPDNSVGQRTIHWIWFFQHPCLSLLMLREVLGRYESLAKNYERLGEAKVKRNSQQFRDEFLANTEDPQKTIQELTSEVFHEQSINRILRPPIANESTDGDHYTAGNRDASRGCHR